MRFILSMLWECIPFALVYIWMANLLSNSNLIRFGLALIVSAIASYLGVKFFDFYVIGKFSLMEGDEAIHVSIMVLIIGIALVIAELLSERLIKEKQNKP